MDEFLLERGVKIHVLPEEAKIIVESVERRLISVIDEARLQGDCEGFATLPFMDTHVQIDLTVHSSMYLLKMIGCHIKKCVSHK